MSKIVAILRWYIRIVDTFNKWMGRGAMYLVFAMMGILMFAAVSRTFFDKPFIWTMEMAQFTMAAYYLLGGGFSMQEGAHVRMDVFYEKWSPKTKAIMNIITVWAMIFYLVIMVWGGWSSSEYALEYGQRNYSAWRPYLAPIKIIMTFGVFTMLLQSFAMFFRDVLFLAGKIERGGDL